MSDFQTVRECLETGLDTTISEYEGSTPGASRRNIEASFQPAFDALNHIEVALVGLLWHIDEHDHYGDCPNIAIAREALMKEAT